MADLQDADLGVVLDGEFAGAAVGGGCCPELAGGLVVGAVAAVLVVPGLVAVAEGLEFGEGGWWGLGGQPGLEGAVVPFDLAAGLRVIGAGVDQPGLLVGDEAGELGRAASGEAGGERRPVVGQHQAGHPVGGEGS